MERTRCKCGVDHAVSVLFAFSLDNAPAHVPGEEAPQEGRLPAMEAREQSARDSGYAAVPCAKPRGLHKVHNSKPSIHRNQHCLFDTGTTGCVVPCARSLRRWPTCPSTTLQRKRCLSCSATNCMRWALFPTPRRRTATTLQCPRFVGVFCSCVHSHANLFLQSARALDEDCQL